MNDQQIRFVLVSCASALFFWASAVSAVTPAQKPLQLGGQVEPNVMFLLDDSGSMRWGYMPDEIISQFRYEDCVAINDYAGLRTASCSESKNKYTMSSRTNTVYYNPNTNYVPPIKADGSRYPDASYGSAYLDGYNQTGGPIDLRTNYRAVMDDYSINFGNDYRGLLVGSAGQGRYYQYNEACGSGVFNNDCYTLVQIGTDAAKRKNFANWFSYYRTRLLSAKTGVSAAFYPQSENIRVGYGSINKGSSTVDGVSTSTVSAGVRPFSGTTRTNFYSWLKTLQASGGTPLRRALGNAGQYYSRTDRQGPWSSTPGETGGTDYSCRQSYAILTTDGYWNGNSASLEAARADVDGDGVANTLGDVAKYYWQTDLHSTLDNNVPTSELNKQKQQHMVTFGVGLGLAGDVQPTPEAAFNAVRNGEESSLTWPDPEPDDTSPSTEANRARLVDLLHASANGRGAFFNAQDPVEFATALSTSLVSIVNLATSNTPGATSSARINDQSLVYQAEYDSKTWSGQLTASRPVETANGLSLIKQWDAAGGIPTSGRKLFTSSALGSAKGVEMLWSKVNQEFFATDEALFDYVRGSRVNEAPSGRKFRARETLLGDIVNSTVKVVNRHDFGYSLARTGIAGYPSFLKAKKARHPVVYVGANDGFLHAFHGETGQELFAFSPYSVGGNLPLLASAEYGHNFFVDGRLHEHDAYIATPASSVASWRTVLLGGLGAGGKGIYALDVTDASQFTERNVMWEFQEADLGYSYSEPVVGRAADGKWVAIFGNGFGKKSDGTLLDSVLYVLDLETGALRQKITLATATGGLASPEYVYSTPDPKKGIAIQHVFAGDYAGNLWRLDSSTSGTFATAFGSNSKPAPLFMAVAGSVAQPITTKPAVAPHPTKTDTFLVYFGTGSHITYADLVKPATLNIQSIYGIWSEGDPAKKGSPVSSRTALDQVRITAENENALVNGIDSRTIEEKDTAIDWNKKAGWFIDLLTKGALQEGERVVQPPEILTGVLFVKTLLPSEDPCTQLDDGWLMALNLASGSRVDRAVLDYNGDGKVDKKDEFTDDSDDGIEQRSGIRGEFAPMTGLMIGNENCYYYGLTIACGERPSQKRVSWEQIDEY